MLEEKHEPSLEERLLLEAQEELNHIKSSAETLSLNKTYASLMGEKYSDFNRRMGLIVGGITKTQQRLDELAQLYATQKGEGQVADRTAQRKLIHDINNGINPVLGFSDLLLSNHNYQSLLGAEYEKFQRELTTIKDGALNITDILKNLSGFYKAQEQQVELVDASTLSSEETVYVIVHVDDDDKTLENVMSTLYNNSNVHPLSPGTFGHNGKRVRYRLHSYSTVEKVLNEIPSLGMIDLLVTDREMPGQDGYFLLNTVNQEQYPKSRKPEFSNVKAIAMLTGGIGQEEAQKAQQTYGIPILTKPFQPLQLEQQIYSIMQQTSY